METQKLNSALSVTEEMIKRMMEQGFADAKYFFALSNMLCENFGLTKDQSIKMIEYAVENC